MLPTTLFASLHHLLAFLVVGLLAIEIALLKPGIGGAHLRLIGKIDLAYGAGFGVLVLIGLARVFWFEKGAEFYADSLAFWAKMVALALVTGLSLPPTFRYLRWGRTLRADAGFRPEPAEVLTLRLWLWAEVAMLALVPALAALMARGY